MTEPGFGVDVGEVRQVLHEGERFARELSDCVGELMQALRTADGYGGSSCVAPSVLEGLVSTADATNRAVVVLLEEVTSADEFFLSLNQAVAPVGPGSVPAPGRLGRLVEAVVSASDRVGLLVAMADLNSGVGELARGDAQVRAAAGRFLIDQGLLAQSDGSGFSPVVAAGLVSEGIGLLSDEAAAELVGNSSRERLASLVDALDLGDERVPVLLDAPPSQNRWLWRVEAADRLLGAVTDDGGWLRPGGVTLFELVTSAVVSSNVRLDASHLDADVVTRPGRDTARSFDFRLTLQRAAMADNVGLGRERGELALNLGAADRLGGVAGAVERGLLLRTLPEPDQLVVRRATRVGAHPGEGLRLADAMRWPTVASDRVALLRWLFPVDEFGNTDSELAAFELGALQGVQLARWVEAGDGTVPVPPLGSEQMGLVAGLGQQWSAIEDARRQVVVDRLGSPAWAMAASANPEVARPNQYQVLEMIASGDLAVIDGRRASPGLRSLAVELVDPANQRVWAVLVAAGGDEWFGQNGAYLVDADGAERLRRVSAEQLEPDVFARLSAQTAIHQLFAPHASALAGPDGSVTEDSVADWLAANEDRLAPIVADRVRTAGRYGLGEDTFGWDEVADGLAVGGIAAFAFLATLSSAGASVPAWGWYGVEAVAVAEAYAAHKSGDPTGAAMAAFGPLGEAYQFGRRADDALDAFGALHHADDVDDLGDLGEHGYHVVDDGFDHSHFGDPLDVTDDLGSGSVNLGNVEEAIDDMVAAAAADGPGFNYLSRTRAAEILEAANDEGLTIDETLALIYYTGDGHRTLNLALRETEILPDGIAHRVDTLEDALDKLPTHQGTVYTGVGLEPAAIDEIKRSRFYTDHAFRSASLDEGVAASFADGVEPGHERVMFEFESKTAAYVGNRLSMHPESEVLFLPGTKFSLVGFDVLDDGTYYLRFVEVE